MILFPNPDGTAADPDLAVNEAKSGIIYVMDPDNMGGYSATSNNVIQQIDMPNGDLSNGIPGNFSEAVYFNGLVYITGNDEVASAFSLEGDQLVLASQSTNVFGSPTNSVCGADPTISANVS